MIKSSIAIYINMTEDKFDMLIKECENMRKFREFYESLISYPNLNQINFENSTQKVCSLPFYKTDKSFIKNNFDEKTSQHPNLKMIKNNNAQNSVEKNTKISVENSEEDDIGVEKSVEKSVENSEEDGIYIEKSAENSEKDGIDVEKNVENGVIENSEKNTKCKNSIDDFFEIIDLSPLKSEDLRTGSPKEISLENALSPVKNMLIEQMTLSKMQSEKSLLPMEVSSIIQKKGSFSSELLHEHDILLAKQSLSQNDLSCIMNISENGALKKNQLSPKNLSFKIDNLQEKQKLNKKFLDRNVLTFNDYQQILVKLTLKIERCDFDDDVKSLIRAIFLIDSNHNLKEMENIKLRIYADLILFAAFQKKTEEHFLKIILNENIFSKSENESLNYFFKDHVIVYKKMLYANLTFYNKVLYQVQEICQCLK